MLRLIFLGTLISVISCSPAREEAPPVARVYDKYLYPSDLEGVVPADLAGPDSMQVVRAYIDNWVRQEVILHKAEQQIAVGNTDFRKQVADYKNSLLIYYYEQALVARQLDTVIRPAEMRAYYEKHKRNFLLPENVYRVAYAELAANAPDLVAVKRDMLDPGPEALAGLRKYCLLHASRFSFTDSSWYSFGELAALLPVDSLGEVNAVPGRVFEIKNKNTVFLIAFRELRKRDSVSPYEMERQHIRQLILNQRRLDLLSEMEKKVFVEALQNNEFEIYDNE